MKLDFQVRDVGCKSKTRVDFVKYAQKVASLISQKKVDYGILCCFSGVGMAIASNRFHGVRAVRISSHDQKLLRLAKEHNNVNLLTFGGGFINFAQVKEFLKIFFNVPFIGLERYIRRNRLLEKNVHSCSCQKENKPK